VTDRNRSRRRILLFVAGAVVLAVALLSQPGPLGFVVHWGVRAAGVFASEDPRSRTFDSAGIPLRYIDVGQGEPVLLLHGFGSNLEENWVETGLVDRLAGEGFRVVAGDARGHGRSGKPHDPAAYGLEDVRDVVRLLDHLRIERAHLVGYSRGGMIAHHVAARYPARVRSLTLGGYGSDGTGTGPIEALSAEEVADSLERGRLEPLLRAITPPDAPALSARERALVRGIVTATQDLRALAAAFRQPLGPVDVENLRASPVPTVAIVGALDPFHDQVHRMAEAVDRIDVHVVAGAGHRDAPGTEAFAEALIAFLRVTGRSPP
jgi:pimeloyl-ACP methyl ester carboxylesterase